LPGAQRALKGVDRACPQFPAHPIAGRARSTLQWPDVTPDIPLSGGDRKVQAKGVRQAHGLHASYYRESILIRNAAQAKIREANRHEREAWNAIMWAGGQAMPSPGDPQAEPTIGKAINGGYDLLETQCNRCGRVSLVALRALRQPWIHPSGSSRRRGIASRAAKAAPIPADSAVTSSD
jgi:hypothetical protein